MFPNLFEYLIPTDFVISIAKAVIILVIGLVTILGAWMVKSKLSFLVVLGGIIAILLVWFVDFEVSF